MPYIRYTTKSNGVQYGSLVNAVRKGNKVTQEYVENLGRVIDKADGIFQSRFRGVFHYSAESGFMDAPSEYSNSNLQVFKKEHLILDFGDSFFLHEYIKSMPFYEVYKNLLPKYSDSLFALLFFCILTEKKANCYADAWFQGNYASLLFPSADLTSQRLSDFLKILGSEEVERRFFDKYLSCLYGEHGTTGILIDSTGMPNASKMSVTQISNHNGDINMEIRLVYVLDRKTGLPIYFRYCSGNIIDVTTLCTTIEELQQYSITADYAIMDAGYFSEENVKELYKLGISFVTRLAPNRKLFEEIEKQALPDLMNAHNAVRYGNRLIYLKQVSTEIYGYKGHAYIGIDVDSRNQQLKRVAFRAMDDKMTDEESNQLLSRTGVFMILSSEGMTKEEILPLYYTRQQIEQVFDIGKSGADLLPIRGQSEETLRGHLMLTFMATALLQSLQRDIIMRRSKKDKINAEGIFINMRNQKCKVYQSEVIPQEPMKLANDIYKLFKMKSPIMLPR